MKPLLSEERHSQEDGDGVLGGSSRTVVPVLYRIGRNSSHFESVYFSWLSSVLKDVAFGGGVEGGGRLEEKPVPSLLSIVTLSGRELFVLVIVTICEIFSVDGVEKRLRETADLVKVPSGTGQGCKFC